MSIESQLREKLRKIEALFAGAGTAGERLAAEAALESVRARLAELSRRDPLRLQSLARLGVLSRRAGSAALSALSDSKIEH